jgi:hypothetical protein
MYRHELHDLVKNNIISFYGINYYDIKPIKLRNLVFTVLEIQQVFKQIMINKDLFVDGNWQRNYDFEAPNAKVDKYIQSKLNMFDIDHEIYKTDEIYKKSLYLMRHNFYARQWLSDNNINYKKIIATYSKQKYI